MKRLLRNPWLLIGLFAAAVTLATATYVYAADVVTASVTPGITLSDVNTLANGQVIQSTTKLPYGYAPISFANGTAAQQVSVQWSDTRTYVASTPVTYDLTALTSASTNTGNATFAKIKVMGIYNNETTAGHDITVSGGASNPFVGPLGGTTPTYTIKAGTAWVFYDISTAGATVDGTHKSIKIDPGSNNCSVSVMFAGN